jgi:ATP-dependent RNA helicase RhlB
MPDIEEYIDQKIPVLAITEDLLAEIIIPAKRPERFKSEYQKKRSPSR